MRPPQKSRAPHRNQNLKFKKADMSGKLVHLQSNKSSSTFQWWKTSIFTALIFLIGVTPVLAHHPLGGKIPSSFIGGLLSGLGHPVIGFDHLAFVIASGLIAVSVSRGFLIPLAFVVATGVGALIHLQGISLPLPEVMIAASVVLFGLLLILRKKDKNSSYSLIIALLATVAGIFHGHAYGEGIFGAETTTLLGYLIGFVLIQIAIALSIKLGATQLIKTIPLRYITRFAGFAIASVGMVFLSSAITG